MKISIWRQFSSNHSASFLLVGEFPTTEQAAEAAEKIRDILHELVAFWEPLSDDQRREFWTGPTSPPTPVEIRLSQKYGVKWEKQVDFILGDLSRVDETITLFDRCVFVDPIIGDTWVGAAPFDALLAKWGARVAAWRSVEDTRICLTVTCLAPDEATAEMLLNDVEVRSSGSRPSRRLWIGKRLEGKDHYDVRREGLRLIYPLEVGVYIDVEFEPFITYLRENGCTEIEYQFSERE